MTNSYTDRKKHTKQAGSVYRKKVLSVLMAAVFFSGVLSSSVPAYGAGERGSISLNVLSENTLSENTLSENVLSEDAGIEEKAGDDDVNEGLYDGNAASAPTPGPSEFIPIGALDDETPIDSPAPLREFQTTLTEQEDTDAFEEADKPEVCGLPLSDSRKESEPAAGAADYSVSYSSLEEGFLPTGYSINQGNSSLCWAYTAAMLTDISMIKNGYKAQNEVRYSADQIGYFFYNRVNDPLGNTPGDKNILLGSGRNYYNRGGNNSFNTWSLASWISPRDYDDLPFKNEPYTGVPSNKAYYSAAHMQNAYWTSIYEPDHGIGYITDVKELIHDHGGVSVIIYSGRYVNPNHAVYGTTPSGGHNVAFIGWDDNYPKENFTDTPPGNGAWYVRDSYDGNSNIDENGCYWMSYYDRSITYSSTAKAIAFDFEKGNNYDYNYQYDGAAGNYTICSGRQEIKVSNVFRAEDDEILKAVGFAPASVSMSYTVNIYKLEEGYTKPENGTSLSTVSGDTRFTGYRTIELTDPVALEEGDIFSVVIDASDTSGKNNAAVYVDSSGKNGDWISFSSNVDEKQSFYYDSDTARYGYNIRIKAYTNDTHTHDMRASYELLDTDDYTYDGITEHKVKVSVVSSNGVSMNEGTDYSVSYLNNINPGTARVSVNSLDGKSLGNRYFTFKISPRSLAESFVSTISSCVYTGTAQKPEAALSDDQLGSMEKGIDYNVEYKDNINAGTGHVTFYGIGRYTGSITRPFAIAPKDESHFDIEDIGTVWYTGKELKPEPVVKDRELGITLTKDVDYTLGYENNINEGNASVSINGIGNYTGAVSRNFVIKKKTISIEGVKDAVYTGSAIEQVLLVKDMDTGTVLTKDTQYSVSYQDNINAGKARIYISISEDYPEAPIEKNFTIAPKTVSCFDVADIPAMKYTGNEICPEPAVKDSDLGATLEKGKDYTVSYNNNINEGDARVYITGKGNYEGYIEKGFFISGAPEKQLTVRKIKDIRFAPGEGAMIPAVTVLDGKTALTEGRDYKMTLSGNDHAGAATVSIDGISGTVYDNSHAVAQFTILQYPVKKAVIEGIGDRLYYEGKDYSKEGLPVNVYVKSALTGQIVTLKEGTDYELVFDEETKIPAKAGKRVYYYIKGIGDYSGSVKKYFTVRDYIPMSDPEQFEIRLSCDEYTYSGSAFRPEVKVTWKIDGDPYDTKDLTEGEDYRLSYSNNKNAGRACVTIKPTSSFTREYRVKGSAKAYFTVVPQNPEGYSIEPLKSFAYNSKARKPAVKVYLPDGKRLASSQYYVKYNNNICVGTAKISVYGKKNHTGLLCSQTFEIVPQSFGKVKLKYKYDRAAGKFTYFRVFYGSSELRENIDYRLKESGPDKNGNYTVSVNAIEGRNFTDDVTKTVKYKK